MRRGGGDEGLSGQRFVGATALATKIFASLPKFILANASP